MYNKIIEKDRKQSRYSDLEVLTMTMSAVLNKLADVLGLPSDLILDAITAQLGTYDAAHRMTVPQITAVVETLNYWTC